MVRARRSRRWFESNRKKSFFGDFYWRGDHSIEGYLPGRPMTLRQRTSREVSGVEYLLKLPENKNVKLLDAPCGYGRHLVEFRRRGYDISGLDLCSQYCEMTQYDLSRLRLEALVRCAELIHMPFDPESFDVVVNLFFSFGFYEDDADNLQCLRQMFSVLKPGGRLLFHTDVNMPLVDSGGYPFESNRTLEDHSRLSIVDRFDSRRERLNGRWTIRSKGPGGRFKYETADYSMRVYYPDDFERECKRAGFSRCYFYGGFDPSQTEYNESSIEMIVIAEKD